MARRTTRRRRGRPRATAAGSNGSAANLLSQVTHLVAENQSLVRENKRLHSVLARVGQAVESVEGRPTRGRRPGPASQPRVIRRRRRITDPASLERRRAALAKARAVLAEKRASKKSG